MDEFPDDPSESADSDGDGVGDNADWAPNDDSETMELDSVDSKHFDKVVDACTLCDMCFMVSCPYVPPHEFAIDIPSLFIRHKAQNQNKKQRD